MQRLRCEQTVPSRVRRVVGTPRAGAEVPEREGRRRPACASSHSSTAINEVGPPKHLPATDKLPRLYDEDYAILALLDRAGLVLPSLIGRAVMPGRDAKTVRHRLTKLYEHGLVARGSIGAARTHERRRAACRGCTRSPATASRSPSSASHPAIHPSREWRALEQRRAGTLPHDLHALELGDRAAPHRRRARHRLLAHAALRHRPLPGAPGRQRPQAPPDHHARTRRARRPRRPRPRRRSARSSPTSRSSCAIPSLKLTFDLLVELDLTGRPSYNREKFLAYDAFLTGWALAHPRYRTLGTRPVVVFVCRDARAALACAREADKAMSGRIGAMGTPASEWYYAGREHTLFAAEPDLHHGSLAALALPRLPPTLRSKLEGSDQLELDRVELITASVLAGPR